MGLLALLLGAHDDAALRLVVLAELDPAVAFGDNGVVLGLARLEQFGDARQATGDVTGLGELARDPRQHVAGMYAAAVLDAEDRVHRHEVAGLDAVGQHHDLSLLIAKRDTRPQIGALGLLFPVDDDPVGDARRLVDHLAVGDALDHVDVIGDSFAFGDDRQGVGIPLGHLLALLDHIAFIDQKLGAVRHAVARLDAPALVLQHDLAVAPHGDVNALAVEHDVAVVDDDLGVEGRLDAGLLGAALGGAADVEGAHGELRSRLTDGLGGDDADGLTDVYRRAAGQITAVTFHANAAVQLAGQHRANQDFLDPGPLDPLHRLLVHQFAGGNQLCTRKGIEDRGRRDTAERPFGQ